MILISMEAGLVPLAEISLLTSFPEWTVIVITILFSFPVGVILTTLSNALLERLCLHTNALEWSNFIPSPIMTRRQAVQELKLLWQRLSGSNAIPDENKLGTLALTVRNIVRVHGSDRVVDLLDRYTGIAILCRNVALISLAYSITSLLKSFPLNAACMVLLIIALPFIAWVPEWTRKLLRLTDGNADRRQLNLPRWAISLAWIVFWTAWIFGFGSFSWHISSVALLIPTFAVVMMILYALMANFENVERLLIVQTADLYNHLEKSWKNLR